MPSFSTRGVNRSKTCITASDFARYFSKCGSTMIAFGHRRLATAIGIAEFTPYLRASYVAAVTTERSESCPTITGRPRRSGRSSSSTEAKKASMSTCSTVAVTSSTGASETSRLRPSCLLTRR